MLKPHQIMPYDKAVTTLETALCEIELISIAGLDSEDRDAINRIVLDVQRTRATMFSKLHAARVEGIV